MDLEGFGIEAFLRCHMEEVGTDAPESTKHRVLICVVAENGHCTKTNISGNRAHFLCVTLGTAQGDIQIAPSKAGGASLICAKGVAEDRCLFARGVSDRQHNSERDREDPNRGDASNKSFPSEIPWRSLELEVVRSYM